MKHCLKFWLVGFSLFSCLLTSAPLWAESSTTLPSSDTQHTTLVGNTSPDVNAITDVSQADASALSSEQAVSTVTVATPEQTTVIAPTAPATADSGDTAWILTSTALVLLMTIPGLALFYGGMVRKKNALSTMMYSFSAVIVVSLVWVLLGYSLSFSDGNMFVGGLSKAMLANVSLAALSGSIPESLFVIFQMTFAIITVAIMSGSFVERMKYAIDA